MISVTFWFSGFYLYLVRFTFSPFTFFFLRFCVRSRFAFFFFLQFFFFFVRSGFVCVLVTFGLFSVWFAFVCVPTSFALRYVHVLRLRSGSFIPFYHLDFFFFCVLFVRSSDLLFPFPSFCVLIRLRYVPVVFVVMRLRSVCDWFDSFCSFARSLFVCSIPVCWSFRSFSFVVVGVWCLRCCSFVCVLVTFCVRFLPYVRVCVLVCVLVWILPVRSRSIRYVLLRYLILRFAFVLGLRLIVFVRSFSGCGSFAFVRSRLSF